MAKSVLELAVGTGQWDAGLKKAKNALDNFTQANGGLQSALNKDSKSMQTFVQMMGRMDSTAKTAKGQMNDYKGTIEQLTMQYNRLTDAQKKTIGQDYLRSIDQMKQKYQDVAQEVAKINQELKQTNELSAGTGSGGGGLFGGDKLSGMLQVFGGNLMTKGAGMVLSFAGELKDMVAQGIELARAGEGVRIAFERLGRGDLLDGLREATHGTVTDLELMKAAVKFNDFKLPLDELGTMLAFAQQKAKDTGQSVDYMVDSIVTGLGRKSLMILDNLGLSATEIRDKMKETGDMTKAVGAIIREQMQKAGDYVETAADRATQANVELTNAMTRLGETFQPVTDMGTSMWTSLKVGALDLLNNVMTPLINKFTELGRIRQQYADQGGDERVNRMLGRLRGIGTDTYRQGTYKAQLANFDTKIGSYQQFLTDYKKWQGDKTAVGAYDRMQAFQKQTGLSMYSDVKEQLAVFQKMRAEYVQGAKAILAGNPAPSPTSTTAITPTGGTSGNTFDASKIAFMGGEGMKANPDQYFQSVWEMMGGDEGRRKMMGIGKQQTDLGRVLNEYVADPDKEKRDKANKNEKDLVKNLSTLTSGISTLTSGIKGLGIELPKEVDDVIGIISSLTSIIQGIQTIISIFGNTAMAANTAALIANTAALTANTVTNFLPFANGGIVRAANGYVDGNTYSNDQIPALLNAGELVLNRSQQGVLASALNGGLGAMQLSAIITGEQIRLVLNNNSRRTGRGEYVTTNFR